MSDQQLTGGYPITILTEGLIAALDEFGHRLEDDDFLVPEMHIAAMPCRSV